MIDTKMPANDAAGIASISKASNNRRVKRALYISGPFHRGAESPRQGWIDCFRLLSVSVIAFIMCGVLAFWLPLPLEHVNRQQVARALIRPRPREQ